MIPGADRILQAIAQEVSKHAAVYAYKAYECLKRDIVPGVKRKLVRSMDETISDLDQDRKAAEDSVSGKKTDERSGNEEL